MPVIPTMKFRLGRLLVTPGALAAVSDSGQTPWDFVVRHMAADWGCVSEQDKLLNDEALRTGDRLLSAYTTDKGVKLWIITEATDDHGNRSATTLLLPEEY